MTPSGKIPTEKERFEPGPPLSRPIPYHEANKAVGASEANLDKGSNGVTFIEGSPEELARKDCGAL